MQSAQIVIVDHVLGAIEEAVTLLWGKFDTLRCQQMHAAYFERYDDLAVIRQQRPLRR